MIVVDNDSQKDDSQKVLSAYPGIIYIESGGNLGFGKANNLGYKHSTGRYVLLLNSDTYLLNNALKSMVDAFDSLPSDVAGIGTLLKAPDGTMNDSYGEFPSISRTIRTIVGFYSKFVGIKVGPKSTVEVSQTGNFTVPYVTGADLCIRREVIEKEGLFDPDFFMYFEETEMQHRYKRKGYQSMIVRGPEIVHLECVSTKGGKKNKFTYSYVRLFLHGQFLYFRKVYSYPAYLLYRLIYLLYMPMFMRSYYSWREKLKIVGLFLS